MLNSRKEENITTMRKNVLKISAIALLSVFALTACDDEVIAKPQGYDDNSPVVNLDKTVFNNNFTDIYDSIREGSLAGDVLNELLYQYSVSVFGNYNKITAAKISDNQFGAISLKEAAASAQGSDKSAADTFIKAHSAYWTKNKAGERVNDDLVKVDDNATPSESEYARLIAKWETIEKRIAKKMYSMATGGTYTERGVFEEERFLRNLASSIENKVKSPAEATMFKGVITNAVEDYELFNKQIKDISGIDSYILHRENYQSNYNLNEAETADAAITYVEDNIIPDIYRQLLVEQYVLDESYDTLGRTSARHISVLSIAKNSNYAKGANDLMNYFVKNKIFDNARTTDITLDDFKVVSNAWVGAFMADASYATTDEYALINAALPDYKQTFGTYNYFQGTAYGDMIEEIKKIDDNPVLSENEGTYTGSNAYPKEIGIEIKTNEMMITDHTSTGWYIKSTGVDGLPDSIKNQLFDINVANALSGDASEQCVEYTYDATNSKWVTNEKADERGGLINVVGNIKGQYFLRNTTRIKDDPVENDILFESDSKYYVVLVEDAIRSKNLNKENYVGKTDPNANDNNTYDKLEEYINEIVELVSNNDTYKNLSKKHWIEKMDLKYHDQVIYDYFKTNFPELFED